jgi:hypothetical protein
VGGTFLPELPSPIKNIHFQLVLPIVFQTWKKARALLEELIHVTACL